MIDLICGTIIGFVMGLTGAGGALVAIPLFMQFMGQSLKEASLYSLLAVVMASLLNFLSQRSHAQYRTGLVIVLASALGSYLTIPLKERLPTVWMASLLALVSLYALYTVWFPKKMGGEVPQVPYQNYFLSILMGLILGALTTFTGLGGGVLMLPILMRLYRFSSPEAVATSLFAVGLSSLGSMAIQIMKGAEFKIGSGLFFLFVGILSAVLTLRKFSSRIKSEHMIKLRQFVFTIVVVLALSKIFA